MIILSKNKSFTGRDLIEKLYSEGWELEQQEYSRFSNIRTINKNVMELKELIKNL